jgi:hypothetical protein
LNQRRRIGFGQVIDDQEPERILEEVVAEGGKELAEEKGRKTARRQQ